MRLSAPCPHGLTSLSVALFVALASPLPARAAEASVTKIDLAATTIDAQGETASDPATTEGTHAYTTGQTAAATRLPLSLKDTPQSVTVVTRQQMDDQQLNSVDQVVSRTTGLSTQTYDTGRAYFYSRGFQIDSFQFDGIPTSFVPGTSFLDTALYDRVEVVRGATGLLTGAGNPSASINLVRKHPTKDFSLKASVSGGSWDNYRGTVDLSTPLTADGRVRARFVAVEQIGHSFRDYYQSKKQAYYGVVDADLSDDTTLSVGYSDQNNTPTGVTWGGMPLFNSDGSRTHYSRSASLAAKWSRWDTRLQSSFANLEHRFDNGWKVRMALDHSEATSNERLLSGLGYPDTGLLPVSMAEKDSDRQNSVDLMASGPFTLLGREHEAVVGYMDSRRKEHALGTGFVYPGGDLQPNGAFPMPEFGSASWSATDALIKQRGAYGALRLSLSDPLKLIVGGRVSEYEITQDSAGTLFDYTTRGRFTPYAGLIYALNDTYSAYASYTEIFNPQSYSDSSGKILEPTTGKNREVGLKASYLDGRVNASLSVFDVRLDNVAQTDTGHFVAVTGAQAYYAASGTKSQGFDFDLNGELADDWNLMFGYSHYTATQGDGTRLSTALPRTTAKLFTTYRLPGALDKLTVGGGTRWQSRFYQDVSGPDGTVRAEQGAYALTSLMARYDLTDQVELGFNLDNLFDKKYYSMMGFYTQALYGDPRNFTVSVSYKL
ncbi:TonB-dependent siderophore receptor [Pseudomonas putida]